MNNTWEIIRGILLLIVLIGAGGFFLFWWLRNSRDSSGRLIAKWIASGVAILIFLAGLSTGPFAVAFALVAGIIMAVLWVPNLTGFFAKPIGDVFDGGDEEPEARPFYSIAIGQRMKGNNAKAIEEIQAQLEKFPNDYEGHLLLASIQAECLHDLSSAQATVEKIATLPDLPAENVAAALNALADWQRQAGDVEAARRSLGRIVQTFPEAPVAKLARQRLAHLVTPPEARRAGVVLQPGQKDLGLRGAAAELRPPAETPGEQTQHLVTHLNQHPDDWEARENLALHYADHFQRLDLASQQLEVLIAQTDVAAKRTVDWLRMLSDLQMRFGPDSTASRQTLQRIIDRFPGTAHAAWAETAQAYLRPGIKPKPPEALGREETHNRTAEDR